MTDAIGHELEIGDYVLAVFDNAELTLFQITGFAPNKKFGTRGRKADCVQLKRTQKKALTRWDNKTYQQIEIGVDEKPIYKPKEQICYVSTEYVLLKILNQ
jgi:hypothetical protein